MLLYNLIEHIPYLGFFLLQHLLWQPALVKPEIRPYYYDGPSGIVHAFTQKILPEPSAFTLYHVAQGFKRALVLARYDSAAPAVVKKGVNSLLQHPLFIPDYDVGGIQFHQFLEPVIPVYNPPVEVI